jgi:hypothetical protein
LSPCLDQDDQRLEAAVLFTGWDWASASHAVTILDAAGEVVDRWVLAHTEQDLDTMLARLASHGSPAELPVAIERADGLVVDRLLAAGHPVVAVDPGAFHAARPRWGAAGAKTDPGDSDKLADDLRTDGHRLRRLEPLDAVTRELQALVRLGDDQVAAKTAASNQLGALLDAHWPGAKQLFFRLASKITLAFLAEFPTPQAAAQLDQAELAAFCPRHADRGGRHPAELLQRLRSAPRPPVGLDPSVLAQLVGAQVQPLATLAELDQAIADRLASIPRSACWPTTPRRPAQPRPTARRTRPDPGPCQQRRARRRPSRRRPGHPGVGEDQQRPLSLGRQSPSPPSPAHLRRQRPPQLPMGGHPVCQRPRPRQAPPQAVRVLGRAWLRVIWTCWHTNTPYDPAKHRAEQRLAA